MTDRPPLLLVDDDEIYCEVLARALDRRGYEVSCAHDAEAALNILADRLPRFAVVDLRMPGASGLDLVAKINALDATIRVVVLTGYASIVTAVEAIKLGATHYLTKPADADQIVAAFARESGDVNVPLEETPISVERLEWEHIQRVLSESNNNISEAARRLGMHRRTLQRKLNKRPARR